MMAPKPAPRPDLIRTDLPDDKRKQVAKARRAAKQEGLGGFAPRSGAKRSERKAPSAGRGFAKQSGGLNYDRRPAANAECACGSGDTYAKCCAPLHDGEDAATPSDLVRARYAAYQYRLPDFLMRTTDPKGDEYEEDTAAWKRSLLGFTDGFEFQKLEVGETVEGDGSVKQQSAQQVEGAHLAQVDFRVNFVQKGSLNLMVLCEKSTFRKVDGKWLYAQGEVSYEAQ